MIIIVKNKDTLLFDDFKFKCSIGKKGFSKKRLKVILQHQKASTVWVISIIEQIEFKNLFQKLNQYLLEKIWGGAMIQTANTTIN